jgi:serine/threonine protein kinase
MSLKPGAHVGVYEVLALLGTGGMGEVYRARDTKLNRDVALKVLPELFGLDPSRLARFKREAQILASLNHPHIAAIYGIEDAPGHVPALVLELVEGPTLAERLSSASRLRAGLPLPEALSIAKQIAEALEAAHEHGIVHRDLKPANIKVRADGRVKVLDFGLAKAAEGDPAREDVSQSPTLTNPALTGFGVVLGTAAYMAPEQAMGQTADARSDIWALGGILYEMLAGKPGFAGETALELLSNVLKTEPDWTALPTETPRSVRSLLRRCLQKDPSHRLRDIADARFQIEDALNEPPGAVVSSPTQARHPLGRLWVAVSVAAVLAAAAGVAWSLRQPQGGGEVRLEINTPPTADFSSFDISPDGRRLAFAATSDGRSRLWVRSLDALDARPLAGTDGARFPFWSPDSQSIGFFAEAQLKRVDVDSGAVQTLGAAGNALGGAWNKDDVILFTASPGVAISRVLATGGQPYQPNPDAVDRLFPKFLPNGRHYLYYGSGTAPGIYVGRLDTSETRRILDAEAAAYVSSGYLLFVRQNTLFGQPFDLDRLELAGKAEIVAQQVATFGERGRGSLSASAAGPIIYRAGGPQIERQLAWFDRSGKEVQRVPGSDWQSGITFALSPDGRRVAFDQNLAGLTDIWVLELDRGVRTRITSEPVFDLSPKWSPDGTRIVFTSGISPAEFDLHVKPVVGSERSERLFRAPGPQNPQDWSPDGRYVLYREEQPKGGLWALPLTGDRKPIRVSETGFDEAAGEFSPDGRWIAYQSNESGRFEIYVQRFPSPQRRWRVSTDGGVQARWRHDGRELFYITPSNRLMAVPVQLDVANSTATIGTPVPLFTAPLGGSPQSEINRQYSVSPDDRRFLLDTRLEITLPITVILNWKPKR